jgi:ATP-binding cassette subfamily F protein 3
MLSRRHIPMLLITFSKVSKDFGGNPVFSEIDLEILEGERIGLVGENGSGKSTLFKLIADIESPSAGIISRRRNLTIGYLTQEVDPAMHDQTLFEAVAENSPELAELPELLSTLERKWRTLRLSLTLMRWSGSLKPIALRKNASRRWVAIHIHIKWRLS